MSTYTIRKRLVAVGRDYDVENAQGEIMFKVDGKVRFARTFLIQDREGNSLYKVREKLLCLDRTYIIKNKERTVATLRRRTHGNSLHEKYDIDMHGQTPMRASGSFLQGRIDIAREDDHVASLSRKPNTAIGEVFYLDMIAGENQALLIGIAMSITDLDTYRTTAT